MSRLAKNLLVVALLGPLACDRGAIEQPPRAQEQAQVQVRVQTNDGAAGRTTTGARVEQSTSTHTGAPDGRAAADPISSPVAAAEVLVGEERERDPRSDTIRVKVLGGEKRQAHVFWGRKDFGVTPLEIERPRNSGPLDLVVIAPGYLPYHARAFTDRDDLISVRLYSAAEAPQLLGYRSSEVPAPTPAPTPGASLAKRPPASAREAPANQK